MVDNRSVPELIHYYTARWQAYAAILNPTLINGNLTFITTVDPLAVIPATFPYPSGGTNLGIINSRVKIKKGADLEDEPPSGLGTVADRRFYKSYKRTVEFQLLSSGRKVVTDIFDDPGFSSDNESTGGGLPDAPEYWLALMFKDAHHDDVYLCYLHKNVTPLPADEEMGGDEPSVINAVFRCYSALSTTDPTCPASPGTQIWRKIYLNGSGSPINPDSPDTPMNPNANNVAYWPLVMSNML